MLSNSPNKMKHIELSNIYGDTAYVTTDGGFIESLRLEDGRQILFPRQQLVDKDRGGVPVCAPVFGPGEPIGLAQHGFARNCTWEVVSQNQDEVKLTLVNPVSQVKNLPHEYNGCKLELTIELADDTLTETLVVSNVGDKPFVCSPGFHPYFATTGATHIQLVERRFTADELIAAQVLPGPATQICLKTEVAELTISVDPAAKFVVWSANPEKYICVEPTTRGFLDERNMSESMLLPSGSQKISMEISWEQ